MFVLGLGVIMASCSTTSTVYRYDENTARYTDPAIQATYVSPTMADLEISSTKVIENVTYDNTLTAYDIRNYENSPAIAYMKSLAVSKVVQKYNADVMVAPIFDIKTSDDFMTITVTVSGYPATFKNFRKMTETDAPAMRVYGIEINAPEVLIPVK